MSDIPINNETDYTLADSILDQIKRDAIEYFGETVHQIRIQYGIERHAFNARTGEVRYSFSPGDFGILDTNISVADEFDRDEVPSIDDDREDIAVSAFDDGDSDDDETPSFNSLADDMDVAADDDGPKFKSLDTDFESIEDAESSFMYEEEYDC